MGNSHYSFSLRRSYLIDQKLDSVRQVVDPIFIENRRFHLSKPQLFGGPLLTGRVLSDQCVIVARNGGLCGMALTIKLEMHDRISRITTAPYIPLWGFVSLYFGFNLVPIEGWMLNELPFSLCVVTFLITSVTFGLNLRELCLLCNVVCVHIERKYCATMLHRD